MEKSQLLVAILFIPVAMQILLPLAMLAVFFLLRLLGPLFYNPGRSESEDSPAAAPQPQKL